MAGGRDVPQGPRPWVYLYRAVDKQGRTVDFLLSRRRDMAAAQRFLHLTKICTRTALTGRLEADQAELTVLHRPDDDGALRATAYRFCASRESLEPAGTFAVIPT